MRKGILIITLLSTAAFFTSVSSVSAQKPASGAVIKFDNMVHDYGIMKEGDVRDCEFKFTNIGNEPIIIEKVEEPCGCTVPSWSKEPVMPGKTGVIKVVYHSKERPGVFRKTLAVTTNVVLPTHENILLMIKGNALTKKEWKQKYKSSKS